MDISERNLSMREFFDRKADGYDSVHEKFAATKSLLTQNLHGDIKKVLDLGGGTGMELIPFFEKFPSARVTVVDISGEMLARLEKRDFSDKVDCICGDFFEVDFGSGYDAVISTSALHHFLLKDKQRLYRKVYECLVSGGVFLNSDKTADSVDSEREALDFYYKNKDSFHCDTPLAEKNELSALSSAGFSDLRIMPTDQSDYRLFAAYKK